MRDRLNLSDLYIIDDVLIEDDPEHPYLQSEVEDPHSRPYEGGGSLRMMPDYGAPRSSRMAKRVASLWMRQVFGEE